MTNDNLINDLFDLCPDGILELDAAYKVIRCNNSASELLHGKSLVGASFDEIFVKDKIKNETFQKLIKDSSNRSKTLKKKVFYNSNEMYLPFEVYIKACEKNSTKQYLVLFKPISLVIENKKLSVIVDAITAAHYDFIKNRNLDRPSGMYDQLLDAYLYVTKAKDGLILIFDEIDGVFRFLYSVASHQVLEQQIQDYVEKCENKDKNLSPLQKFFEKIIQTKATLVEEYTDSSNFLIKDLPIDNFLGIPLINQDKVLGLVCLFNIDDPYEQMIYPNLLALHQTCVVMAVGYQADQIKKETLALMKVKDEMLEMYLSRLEKQNLELALAKKEADSANQAKSSFITNLGHEFRTPLTTIMGTTELLMMSALNEKQTKSAKTIYSSSELLLNLMNDLLDIAKIEAGELKIESIPVNLSLLVEDVVSLFTLKAYQKALEFQVYLDPNLPTVVLGDPIRLRQVLLNFLGNAFKFTSQGYVLLSLRSVKNEEGPFVCFEVQDTGIGIPLISRDKLFKKFSQLDPSITRKFGGTGLGLAISKQIIEMMNGTIGFSSEEDKGSTFWFQLPLKASEPSSVLLTDSQRDLLKTTHLFIASPKDVTRNILKLYLKDYLDKIELSEDLQGLCKILASIDLKSLNRWLVIVDLQLVSASQHQNLKELRSLVEDYQSRMIIIASAEESISEQLEILQELSPNVLYKPFLQKDVINILIKELEKLKIT